MKKIVIALIMTAAVLFTGIVGCTAAPKDADVKEVYALIEESGYLKNMVPVNKRDMFEVYGIKTDNLVQSVYYQSENCSTNADEIAIFEVSDSSYIDELVSICNTRISSQITRAEDYSQEEVTKLKKTKVRKVGNYVYYVVSDDYNELMKILKDNIG